MDLTPHVVTLREHLAAAVLTDEHRELAGRLAVALEPAARLSLLAALSSAADEISAELAPGSVEVRLRGGDPEFVVRLPDPEFHASTEPPAAPASPGSTGPAGAAPSAEGDDAGSARVSLRLPDALKTRAEAAAARDGLSLNAWLTRAVADALAPAADRPASSRRGATPPGRFTGWAR